MVVQENQNCSIGNSFGVATNGQKLKRRGSIRAPAILTKGIIMKKLACATGLVVLCLLKATLVWDHLLRRRWRTCALRRGMTVLDWEQPRGPGRATFSAEVEK